METQEAERPIWTPELSMQIRGIGQVRVSPDGRRVAYTVTEPIMETEKSETLTQIWLANADGSEKYQATFADKSSTDPQWSPDGKWLAFTSKRGDKNQLFRMRASGGEAERLTEVKSDIGAYLWSPDGSRIGFLMSDPKTEDEEKRDKSKDDAFWVNEDLKYVRLYVVPVEKDADGKREPKQLTAFARSVSGFDWSPDGRTLAFAHTVTAKADDWTTGDLATVDAATGEIKPLHESSASAAQPHYSPDGSTIAFTLSDDPPHWAGCSYIHLIPASGGTPRALAPTPNAAPFLVGWSANGSQLYYGEATGTEAHVYALDIPSGAIAPLTSGHGIIAEPDLNRSRRVLGYVFQSSEQPLQACVSSVEAFAPVTLDSGAKPDMVMPPLGRTEVLRWQSSEGMEIEGLLTYPVGYTAGQRVPLLLVVHGGPAGYYAQTFIGNPNIYPVASFAAQGYAVLRCNPRGSTGYGKDFRYANQRDWGGGDYRDLMAGVDHVIGLGVADPERLGVMGWSYGGFMTSWIITQTQRFKASSVGAGVTNIMSFNGTADIPSFVPDYFGAESWEDLELYRDHCAMFQVKGVKTPTLVQHGDADVRVPISQGYELYNALHRQNVETRMIVLPRQPHGPTEPRMLLKVMQTNLDWFAKYLKP
ncbi:MAG: putative secreted peptidase [Chthonomonadaceae bacterium]|nr:putative secreted peptidase [Chthonomonadaceae bacterium]